MGLIVPNGIHDAKAVIAVNTSGDYQPYGGGAGAGVTSVNSLTGGVTIAGAGNNTVTTAGSTITISGTNVGTITGPAASINLSLVRWSGVAGTAIQDSLITSNGSNLTFPAGGSLILAGAGSAAIGDGTNAYNSIHSARFAGSDGGSFILSGTNSNTIWAGKHLDILAAQGQAGNFIRTSGNITPLTSGLDAIGRTVAPYSTGYFNQLATTFISGAITAATYSISWTNGSSQAIGFSNGFVTGVTLSLTDGIPGSTYNLEVYNNASGTANLTWAGNIKWQQSISGTATTSGNAQDFFTFYCKPNNVYYGMSSYNFF